MIWLTWRQFRTQAWVALGLLAVAAVTLAITGPQLYDLYRSTGLAACTSDCGGLAENFLGQVTGGRTEVLYWAGFGVLALVPALVGIFWGAPLLSRELETGTYRLVWNQSVTSTRWLLVKLVSIGIAAVVTAGLLSLGITWWTGPIDDAYQNRMLPEIFASRGVVPIGYAAFAFAAGVAAGMLVRRTVPAMAVTLVLVAAAQLAVPFLVRPHLVEPVRITAALDTAAIDSFGLHPDGTVQVVANVPAAGAWVLDNRTITASGAVFTGPVDPTACGQGNGPRECFQWLATQNLRQDATYVPADRFWTLQWREAALFLAAALLIAGFCVWWVRRRVG